MMRILLFITLAVGSLSLSAQQDNIDKIRSFHLANEPSIINDFVSFLSIPNVATDTANIRKNASWLVDYMNAKGIANTRLLEADEKNIPPVVYAEVDNRNARGTIVFYAHY